MSICPTWLCGSIVAAGAVLAAANAEAQGFFNTNQQGGYPSGSTGTGGSTSSMFSNTGFGNSSSAFGGSSAGATGQQGLGQIGFGNTGQAGRNATNGMQGPTGFLGANNNTNNFLGRNTQGQQANVNQNQQRGNRGQRGLDQELQNLLNGNGQFGNNANTSRNTGVRPRQKVAFEHPTLQGSAIVAGLEDRFEKLGTRYPHLKGIELSVAEDGAIVLTGAVDSEHVAKMTVSLVRLEPGVKTVRSELTFPPPAAE